MYQAKVFNCITTVRDIDHGYRWIDFHLDYDKDVEWYRARMDVDGQNVRIRAVFGLKYESYPESVQHLLSSDSIEITKDVEKMIKECTSEKNHKLMQKGIYQPTQWDKDFEYACGLGNAQAAMKHMEKTHKLQCIDVYEPLLEIFLALQPCTVEYTLDQFTEPRIPQEELATKTIVLTGGAGYGKTSYAMAHFKNPVVISSSKDYFKINPANDGIIFDELKTSGWTPSEVRNLVDLKLDGLQKVMGGAIYIPKGIPRFIIHLDEDDFWPKAIYRYGESITPGGLIDYELIDDRIISKYINKPVYNISKEEIEEDINKNPTTLGTVANPSRRVMKRKRSAVQRRLKKLKTPDI